MRKYPTSPIFQRQVYDKQTLGKVCTALLKGQNDSAFFLKENTWTFPPLSESFESF